MLNADENDLEARVRNLERVLERKKYLELGENPSQLDPMNHIFLPIFLACLCALLVLIAVSAVFVAIAGRKAMKEGRKIHQAYMKKYTEAKDLYKASGIGPLIRKLNTEMNDNQVRRSVVQRLTRSARSRDRFDALSINSSFPDLSRDSNPYRDLI